MKQITLNEVIRNMYNNEVSFIKEKNRELEREFFRIPGNIPLAELTQGFSYEENFEHYKEEIKDASEEEIDQIFTLLKEYFLFSYGHDMMFKTKLKADLFTSAPMHDFLYPKLESAVKAKYNDLSVMDENPNFEKNIQGIAKILDTYLDAQSTLYLIYCNDFQFPSSWEGVCNGDSKDVLKALNNSGITIGDFLHALIDDKCKTIKSILNEINNPNLRRKFLEQLEEFRKEKHNETAEFSHVDLPVTFFLDHTIMEFVKMEHKSPLLAEDKPKVSQKLYIPNND